jgi:DNA-binding transcriptional ArsR family regulator
VPAPFTVLAEPARRRILDLLLDRPHLVGELAEALGLSQPGTSKHLAVLRAAGLVTVRREAQRRWYALRPEPLAEVDAWLAPYRARWTAAFDQLEAHLDAMDDDPGAPPGSSGSSGPSGSTDRSGAGHDGGGDDDASRTDSEEPT